LIVGISSSLATTVSAADRVEVENIHVGFGDSNSFKVGTWTPVWVQLKGASEPFKGMVELVVGDDDGTPSAFKQYVEIAAKESQRLTMYARPGSRDPELTIRIFDAEGHRVSSTSSAVVMKQQPSPIMPSESVILTLGQPLGLNAILDLPGFKKGTPTADGQRGLEDELIFERIDGLVASMPGRWYGYDAAQVIVIDTADRETIASLDPARGQALVDWVKRGGHLVVSVGDNWQAVRDSILGPILPGLPTGQGPVPSLEALDTFAGASKPLTPPGAPAVLVTNLDEVAARNGIALSVTSNLPLIVRGPQGFGRVTLIALDTNRKIFSDWQDRGLFWLRALDLKRQNIDPASAGMSLNKQNSFYQSGVTDLSSQLRIALEQFSGVKLIPFGWVAFFIFIYVLLIGPGDYFFLKRVLKRMELTWITFPLIVVTVSTLAYFAAYKLKGNDLLVNKLDLVDIDQPEGLVRGTTWSNLFSPRNRDYAIRSIPLAIDEPPAENKPGTSVGDAPRIPAGADVVMTWFSSPEEQFGSMGSSSRRFNFVGGGYSYEPVNSVQGLQDVRIPIWSTKCITARWFGPSRPVLESDLQPFGTDRLSGTITNRLDIPLDDTILAYGSHVWIIGKVEPGASFLVQLITNDRNLSSYLKEKYRDFLPAPNPNRQTKLDSAGIITGVMFHDSISTLTTERLIGNGPLHELDLTGQLALERPMLVARVNRPGSRLLIDNEPPTKLEQKTVLRVILPLSKPKS
jgi:hypothetical protein